VAWADGETESVGAEAAGNPAQAGDPGDSDTATSSAEHQDPGEVIRRNIERAADDIRDGIRKTITGVVRSSGGAITSTHRNGSTQNGNGNVPPVVVEDDEDLTETPLTTKDGQRSAPLVGSNAASVNPVRSFVPQWRPSQAQGVLKPSPKPLPKVVDDVKDAVARPFTDPTTTQRDALTTLDAPSTEDVQEVRPRFVAPVAIITNVLNAAIAPFLNPTPGQPAPQNPVLWAVLGWVRRQVQDTPFGKIVLNRTPRIDQETTQVVDNGDGTFTITPSAADPDGDELTYTAGNSGAGEGTLTDNGDGTFTYTVTAANWDQSDTVTLTVSDAADYPHFHGLAGIVSPDGGHTDTITVTIAPDDGTLPPPPEVVTPPTERQDGSGEFDTVLQYNPSTTANVSAAPGFEPKYWTVVSEEYDPITGKYTAVLKPTQAGQLRAALGLDTTDQLKLDVTGQQQTVQTFALRSTNGDTQFGALAADEPDQALTLPTPPAGHFEVGNPVVTSPGDADITKTYPAGTVVTDRYAYVVNSRFMGRPGTSTLSVIGADPQKADYRQVVEEIEIDGNGSSLLTGLAGDRLYVGNSDGTVAVIDTDGVDPIDEADDNTVLAPIELGQAGAVNTIVSPDGKRVYVVNQQLRKLYVIDSDPANTATYNTVIDEILVADSPVITDNGDGTSTVRGAVPLSGAFNADGTRLYVIRDIQQYTTSSAGTSDFTFDGDIVVIDTASNEVVGDPVPLGKKGYFASSDGKYLYVPTLDTSDFDPTTGSDTSTVVGSVTVIDVQDPDNPAIVAELPTGNLPVNVAFSPDKSLAYVVDAGTGTIWVIDTANQEVIDLDQEEANVQGLVFDPMPAGGLFTFSFLASSPDGTQLFVTNFNDGTVTPLEFVTDDV
jgi:DNA-binding beta-propeller fold protein YncE